VTAHPELARRLGLGDAVLIGLGSMVGAGLFAAFTPAAVAAGSGLLVGLLLAAVVAWCNATSSAQLAARYPVAGGTYHYGREELGPWWGFAAGWGFVVGKTASSAAMALTFAAYALPAGWWQRPAAAVALLVLALVNCRGITRTAQLTRLIVAVVITGLAVILVLVVVRAILPGPAGAAWSHLGPAQAHGGWHGVLQAGGLLFFAFAGYARIATLGEEVRDPARTIPRAIVLALLGAVTLYALVAGIELLALGADGVAATPTPLVRALSVGTSLSQLAPVLVRVVAAIASLGALLALIAGIGRTTLAMARTGDLPAVLAAVHPVYRVPYRAELATALVAILAVLAIDLRSVIGFSSFGVLLYYAVANLSAFRQPAPDRRYPRTFQLVGLAGCLVLAAALPPTSVIAGVAVFAIGFAYRAVRLHRQGPSA
jgi:basic amino acid/polyamine antiporter, APA family